MKILVLNSGSSSLKYQLLDMENEAVLAKGNYERIGEKGSVLTHKVKGKKSVFEKEAKDHGDALELILKILTSDEYGVISSPNEINAVGHRVVNGGDKLTKTVIVNDKILQQLIDATNFAPLHNPAAISGVNACKEILPDKPNVLVFDTSFHQTMKPAQYIYPIPYEYFEKYKIRRYGAHGMSHEYVVNRLAELKGVPLKSLKVINCHLGQGASLCAVKNGECVDTSMGFTPLAGIPMGSRSGDLDPSVVTFIMKKENLTPDEMEKVLNKKSGIYGISGISVDFRDVEQAATEGNERAKLAMDIYIYDVACKIAEYMVPLQGCDAITFTAGVGEKGSEDREAICEQLKVFGVEIDKDLNNTKGIEGKISSEKSKIEVWVIPTNEELWIARDTLKICKESGVL